MYSILIKKWFSVAIVLLCLISNDIFAQQTLSDEAQLSILTCGKGNDLYNTFGHTGIHVRDLSNNIDVVFNYGMFSFGGSSFQDQMEFGVTFAQGKLDYWLGIEDFNDFVRNYEYQERWVFEQVLNLDQSQKQHLFNALVINLEPENRYYQYDFFFDNCSSRVRDILEDAVGDVFGDENSAIHQATNSSFIDLIHPYIKGKPWLDFGMDVMLGLPSSRKASKYEFMFLPYHLKDQIGLAEGLVKNESYIVNYPLDKFDNDEFHWLTPFTLFLGLFILVSLITYRNYKANKHYFWLDRVWLGITGVFGTLFLLMWIGTNHLPAHVNLNMFWAFPLNLVALFFVKKVKWNLYFKVIAGFAAFIPLAWFLSPQQYHIAVLPLVGICLVRYLKRLDFVAK